MTSKLGEQGSLHARSLAVSQRAAPVGQVLVPWQEYLMGIRRPAG